MAAGEYLPPLVTELKADIKGLKAGFDEARAEAKKYKKDVEDLSGGFKETSRESERTGKAISDFERLVGSKMGSSSAAVKTLRREYEQLQKRIKELRAEVSGGRGDASSHADLKRAFGDLAALGGIGADLGIKLGDGFGKGVGNAMSATGPIIQTALVVALVGAAVLAAPAMGAAISAAVVLGVGAGVIGLAAMILKDDKQIKKAWEKLTDTTSKVFEKAAQPMKKPFIELLGWLNVEFKKLQPELTAMFAAAAPLVKPLGEGIFGILKNMLPGITEALKNAEPVFKTLGEKLPLIGTAIGEFFKIISENPEETKVFLEDMIELLAGAIVVLAEFISWLTRAYVKVKDFAREIKSGLNSAGTAISEWWEAAKKWVSEMFGNLGKLVMNSLIGGITLRKHALRQSLGSAMGEAVSAAKKALDSRSPSRVMMRLGVDTVDGYVGGVEARLGRIRSSLAGAMNRGIGAATAALPAQRGGMALAMEGTANIYLDSRLIQQAGIKFAQRDKIRNTSSGWS